ncbi:MAG: Uncharacterised protein [Rhodobiaceae bacterium UBA7378]|nr:MAG: Uncharacterised protein [Rhodobiaceae bacterium UBA7378]
MSSPAPEILAQLETLELDASRPLIISDADEVLLKFMAQLEHFLDKHGLWIDLDNYAISGNIKSRETNEPVEFPDLIDAFFDAETHAIQPTIGAAQSLETLAARAQIIVLTNLPAKNKQARIDNLNAHGMDYPVVVGSGPKGPAVAWLKEHITAPVFFLDDIPHNVDSVAEHAPDVRRIHFIADPRLAKLIGPAKGATTRIDVWNEAYDWISQELTQAGY